MSDYCMEGYQRLAAAVVEQAVVDYTRALRRLSRHPHDADAKRGKEECDVSSGATWGCIQTLMGNPLSEQSEKKSIRR